MNSIINPFTITKAVDLSDEDILKLWVNLPEDESNNLIRFIKPTSLMPMFIIGGKGSGKTHLLRYLSFQVRKLKYKGDIATGLKDDGFLALYLRCSGMNASRFCGKGVENNIWQSIFSYYFELWTAQNTLAAISAISTEYNNSELERAFCKKIARLFDTQQVTDFKNINEIISYTTTLLKELDYAVNNCIYEKCIFPSILCTAGTLIYNIPSIFNDIYAKEKIIFQYIFDEFENFDFTQQVHINTLVRERSGDCSIKVGSRLIGIRTHKTLCADEENKQGSEFELVSLDEYYRGSGKQFDEFAIRLINARLEPLGLTVGPNKKGTPPSRTLAFEKYDTSPFDDMILSKVFEKDMQEREYIKKFKKNISSSFDDVFVTEAMDLLKTANHPLLQKAVIYHIYIQISKKESVDFDTLKEDLNLTLVNKIPYGVFNKHIHHYKSDFIAQLCREFKIQMPYAYDGINSVIDIAMANPRHLLILFKYIYDWAIYRDETNSQNPIMSIEAQESGISKAADWFYSDAKLIGADGDHVQDSIARLCDLFRRYRYSDKPAECSVCIFSVDFAKVTARTRQTLDIAKKWLLIIDVGTHNTKNAGSKIHKFQINKLLSPRWELAVAKRGTVQLSSTELDTIFDEKFAKDFIKATKSRIQRMTYPFSSKEETSTKKIPNIKESTVKQGLLFGDEV